MKAIHITEGKERDRGSKRQHGKTKKETVKEGSKGVKEGDKQKHQKGGG